MNFSDLKIKSAGKFLKIEPGEPQDIRLYSEEPIERMIHGFGKEAFECSGKVCSRCVEGSEVKQRFSINIYNHNTQKVMIWDFGSMIATQLKKIAISLKEEGRSIMDVDLKVDATGSNQNKKYTVTPRMSAKQVPVGLVLYKLDSEVPF